LKVNILAIGLVNPNEISGSGTTTLSLVRWEDGNVLGKLGIWTDNFVAVLE
jgi:hypothetical protein